MDILTYSASQQAAFTAMEKKEFNYETQTTFWGDFTIADSFGIGAVRDTYERAKKGWGNNRVYFTELCLVLNHKCWYWFERNQELSELYKDLFYDAQEYVYENWNVEDREYYFEITD